MPIQNAKYLTILELNYARSTLAISGSICKLYFYYRLVFKTSKMIWSYLLCVAGAHLTSITEKRKKLNL